MIETIKDYIEKYKADLENSDFDAFYSHMQAQTLRPLNAWGGTLGYESVPAVVDGYKGFIVRKKA